MKITVVSSSTRISRISPRIAFALEKAFTAKGHDAQIIDLAKLNLPPFRERYSRLPDKPQRWTWIMDLLKSSDGLIFLTPEYNGSISSGLKNFIDVFAKDGFKGKPIGVATGSTGSRGGIRAAYQVQRIILSLFAYPQPDMLLVGEMQKKFDESGQLLDKDFQPILDNYVETFIDFTQRHI